MKKIEGETSSSESSTKTTSKTITDGTSVQVTRAPDIGIAAADDDL